MPAPLGWLLQRWIELLLGVGSLCVYALTAYPGLGGRLNYGDSVKFQLMPVVDGVPHATGYPLYLMLTEWVDVLVPWGTPASRVTAFSCLCGSVAVVGAYRLGRGLGADPLPSALAAMLLGGSYTFWVISTEAEVYALHVALGTWVLVLLLRFQQERRAALLAAAGALFAASLGNHLMTLTLLPAIGFAVLTTRPDLLGRFRFWLGAAGLALAGLLQYGYILYRSHLPGARYLEYVNVDASVERVLRHMMAAQFADRFFAYELGEVVSLRAPLLGHELLRELTVVGVLFAAWGLGSALRWPLLRRGVLLVGLAALGQLALSVSYEMEEGPLFVPIYVAATGWIALGVSRCRLRRASLAALGAAALAGAAANLAHRNVLVDGDPYGSVHADVRRSRGCSTLLVGTTSYADAMLVAYLRETGAYPTLRLANTLEGLPGREESFCVAPSQREYVAATGEYRLTPRTQQSFESYLEAHTGHLVVLSVKDDGAAKLSRGTKAFLRSRGSSVDRLAYRGSYAAALLDGRLVFEALSNRAPVAVELEAGDRIGRLELPVALRVTSAGLIVGNRSSIRVGDLECSPNLRGFNVAVFDEQLRLIEATTVDTYLGSDLVDVYLAERISDRR
jgi:hypothetical protein